MTVDELKHWFETLLVKHEEKDVMRHMGEREAVEIAAGDIDRRLKEMNEFRGAMSDQRATFVTRELHDKLEGNMDTRLKLIEQRIANWDGKLTAVGVSLGLIFTLVQFALHFWVP